MKTRSAEWITSGTMTLWGILVLGPWNTFAHPTYHIARSLAPEEAWGAISLAIGFVRLVALYINGTYFRTPVVRMIGAFMGTGWWLLLFVLLYAGSNFGPPAGLSFYIVFVFAELYACVQTGVDAHVQGSFRATPKAGLRAHG